MLELEQIPVSGKLYIIGGNHYNEGITLSGRKNDGTALTTLRFFHDDENYAHIARGSSPSISISAGGNVGIGTNEFGLSLEVSVTNDTEYANGATANILRLRNTSLQANSYAGIDLYGGQQTETGVVAISRIYSIKENTTDTATSLAFATRSSNTLISEAMRINSSNEMLELELRLLVRSLQLKVRDQTPQCKKSFT